ncbi:MAG TPA: hypothetical protein VD736_06640 [Nitrososphaera sp.]|nr:hypothetical protein [Nitrososphaera sp.]
MKSKMKTFYISSVALSLMISAGTFGISYGSSSDGFQDEFNLEECTLSPNGANDYFFLEPGYELVLEGVDEGEEVVLIITVLEQTKEVDGTETRIVEERESADGELVEVSRNFFAICVETGDIFYFGEEVDDYEDGEIVSHEGEWEAGVNDARAGLIVPGNPEVGMKYYQEVAPSVAEDRAEVLSLSEELETPAGDFEDVLKVEETTPLEPGVEEYKFHAPGVGLIQDGPLQLTEYMLPDSAISGSSDDGFQDEFNLDECEMSSTGKNNYFFLQPGYQLTLEGEEDREEVQLILTVLSETKVVDGIETRIVEERESVDGELVEISRNFFAICTETGDVFYFGEEVVDYEDGKIVGHEGEWEAGVDEARAGLIVPANPEVGMKYYQEIAPGVAEDRAEIISLNEVVNTPAGRFNKVLQVEESNPLEGNEKEYKFHAPGIGLIQDEDLKLVKYVLPEAEDGDSMADERMDRRKAIAARESGEQIHQRHMQASPASRGEYTPGLDYALEASGATSGETNEEATLVMDISVWKSNGAVVIMDVIGGTVNVGNQDYDIHVGYALYSIQHNVFRSAALAVGEDGDVLALRLYGTSLSDVKLATPAGGTPVGLAFEGDRNLLGGWTLEMDGAIQQLDGIS